MKITDFEARAGTWGGYIKDKLFFLMKGHYTADRLEMAPLLNKYYRNEVTLTGQNPL